MGKTWYAVDDSDVLTIPGGLCGDYSNGYISSGRKVPTVRERIEMNCPIVVMDADSAAKGTELLERQIAAIEDFREGLPEFIEHIKHEEDPMAETLKAACPLIDDFLFVRGYNVLTDPDIASYHVYADGIYDAQYLSRRFVQVDSSDISEDEASDPFAHKAPDPLFEAETFNVRDLSGIELEITVPQARKTVLMPGYSRYSQQAV